MPGSGIFRTLLLLMFVSGQMLFASEYHLKGNIKGISESKIFLQEFYGDQNKVTDSAMADLNGNFSFTVKSEKPPGQYRLIFANRRFLDFIFNQENIQFTTSLDHLIDDMKVTESTENYVYYQYLKFRVKSQKRIDQLSKQLYSYDSTKAFFAEAKHEYLNLIRQEDEFTNQLLSEYPQLLVSSFIKIDREPRPDPSWNKAMANQWVFEKFPEYFQFNDTLLLRSNAVSAKIIAYLSVALSLHNHPDSLENILKTASFRLLASTGQSEKMFRFMNEYLSNGFVRLGYKNISAQISEIPFPCCTCRPNEKTGDPGKTSKTRMPSSLILKTKNGEKATVKFGEKSTILLIASANCKWSELMIEGLMSGKVISTGGKRILIIYRETETAAVESENPYIYFISDKEMKRISGITEIQTIPMLITINEKGEVLHTSTSWLELI
ncbi:MAG: hypothetical protein CVT94_12035 [Bacteroidetes bacterium HGW-Bacteroidetes-11]|jgi:hypothetical protein|nr:MAG: hypothetical protein CVT94_12035 [Bacteroidetes bacterium HGW-Bacteroidetes-11]